MVHGIKTKNAFKTDSSENKLKGEEKKIGLLWNNGRLSNEGVLQQALVGKWDRRDGQR